MEFFYSCCNATENKQLQNMSKVISITKSGYDRDFVASKSTSVLHCTGTLFTSFCKV